MNLTFANAWMLAGAALVGLPVLIHFLTRARPKRVVFPPFKFLVEACAGQQSLHRLRTIILLTLRCLAVVALVLLFARPALMPKSASSKQSGARVALIVDASLSMRALQRGMPLFARAQAEAADLLRNLDAGSEAAVILAGATPRPLLPALSHNISALHDALVKAEATYEAADPAAALALAKKFLGDAGTIYVFSDFQQSNWKPDTELPAGTICRLRSVADSPVENLGLTSIRLSPATPVPGEPVEVICTVFNASPRARKETVRLELAGLSQSTQLALTPFNSAEAAFTVSFPQAELFMGFASLEPDDLREDNTRHVAVRVHKSMQILVLSDADANDHRSGAFFVSHAIAPSSQAAPGLAVVRRHSQDADRGILETADAFVITAPATLSGEALEVIARRVKDGASLIVFLDGASSSALLMPALTPPFQLLRAVNNSAGESFLPATRKLFAQQDAAEWNAVRVHRHFQAQLLQGRNDDVLLSYADGSPALTLSAAGKGSVVFANLPLTPDGTDLIGHPLFPSMMHELLRVLRRGDDARDALPGASWTLDAQTSGEGAVVVIDPRQRSVPTQTVASGRMTRLALPVAEIPGAYLARQGEALVGAGVVNIDPKESDTRPVPLEKIRAATGSSVAVLRDEGELSLGANVRPLWPQCAAAAAIFFALEMLLLAFWRATSRTVREASV